MEKKQRFRVSKWICLSFAILLNSFLIVYSCLSQEVTAEWNNVFTNFFAGIVNNLTPKTVEKIPLESINAHLSDKTSYAYNYLPGYKVEEIPLGSAKQIECSFAPEDATDKSISYSASPSENVVLNQSGTTLSVVGMKVGECVITAKSNDGGFESSVKVNVVETVAPVSYEISLDKTDIAIGETQTINFDIDGGVLTHNELINFRYYDIRKLSFSSLDESIAKVDNYGVIYPQDVGSTTITVKNGEFSRSIDVSISAGTPHPNYSNLSISGSNVCYANDMILDQNSKKNHYQLTPLDGETELNPADFIWESSNELLVKVDKHGVMRGFRKSSLEDETATITAKSKLTGQTTSINITVQNQLPTVMNYCFIIEDNWIWNKTDYLFNVGDDITLLVRYDVSYSSNKALISSDNESIISVTNEGNQAILHILSEGSCNITVESVLNPELKSVVRCKTVPAGAISSKDMESFGTTVRKSLGHAAIFMVAQIFTFLSFFMFDYERKWYVWTSMSLGEGLFISGLSEIIQAIVPSRHGSFIDVLINFAGVVVGTGLTLLGIFIVHKIKEKKNSKKSEQ